MEGNKASRPGVVHVPPREGDGPVRIFGELVTSKVKSDRTGGAYSLFEVTTRPGGGPPPHVQHWEDEAFFVLEGEHEFLTEHDTLRVGPGSLVYVPRGRLHAYTNVGSKPGRVLALQTPGGLHERFLEEIDEGVEPSGSHDTDASPDFGSVAEIAARYGIEIPLPEGTRDEKETG